jgi:F-box interacting protein
MTFKTHDDAEKILYTYNRLKVMPGTEVRFCLNWAFSRSRGEKPKYKTIRIFRTIHSSNDRSIAPVQLPKSNNQVKESSDLKSSSGDDYIPHDLIYGILLLLSAESIIKVRVACKAWSCITRTDQFIRQHLENRRSRSNPVVSIEHSKAGSRVRLLSNQNSKLISSFRILNFQFPYGFAKTYQCFLSNSCNGLVCIYDKNFVNVVNPTIRETVQLPTNFGTFERENCTNLLFVAIGYDDISDTYKIVRGYGNWFPDTKIEVLTLGGVNASYNWRRLEGASEYIKFNSAPVFLNGAIYWFCVGYRDLIYSFEVRTEAIRTIPVPEGVRPGFLTKVGGNLCIMEYKFTGEVFYMLEDYDNCNWIKKDTIGNCPDATPIHRKRYFLPAQSKSKKILESRIPFLVCDESLVSPISYLQKSNGSCAVFSIFGQRWAAQFPMNYVREH